MSHKKKVRAATPAALVINEFLQSQEAGIEVTEVSQDALKKAIKKYFSKADLELMTRDGKVFLINKRLVMNE